VFDFLLHILIVASLYGIVSISLNLQAGVSGMMNFGQIAFFGIGGYAAALCASAGYPVAVGIAVGVFAADDLWRHGWAAWAQSGC
jgi:branched-chain amino acid transport system permease protein